MSRRTRHFLPMCDKFLKPEIVEDVVLGKERRNYKIKQKFDEGAKYLDILKERGPGMDSGTS